MYGIPNHMRGGRHRYNSSIFVPPLHQSAESDLTPNSPGSGNGGDLGVAMFPFLSPASSTFLFPSMGHRAEELHGQGGCEADTGMGKGRGYLWYYSPLK